MKKLLVAVVFLVSSAAFAQYEAIAYNPQTGQVAGSRGYSFESDAVNNALYACQNAYPYQACTVMNTGYANCIALAADHMGHWGRAQNFPGWDQNDAVSGALNACGSPECTLLRVECN